jgi:diketogulonate reductase-like aldo/keto reductase
VTSVLLGCRNVAQLEDNLGGLDWELSSGEMDQLTDLSAPGIPIYPHGFLEVEAGVDVWERLATRRSRPY